MTGPTASDRKRALAAERQRRYRARRRVSILLRAEMERFGFVEALVETGRLGQWDEDDRRAIDHAATMILSDWQVYPVRDATMAELLEEIEELRNLVEARRTAA